MIPILHILMRDDLASLNPGKAIAQGSHATNDFEAVIQQRARRDMVDAAQLWREDRTFGTCLTRAAKPYQIDGILDMVNNSPSPYVCGKIIDPTYPITDGEVTHHLPMLTCAWVFTWDLEEATTPMDKKICSSLRRLSLYK
jgi:hypothetical protein